MSPARMIVNETKAKAMKDRPGSKLTPRALTSPSILVPEVLEEDDRMEEDEEGREKEFDDDDESRNRDEQQRSTSPSADYNQESVDYRLVFSQCRLTIRPLFSYRIYSVSARFLSFAEYNREITVGCFITFERRNTIHSEINKCIPSFFFIPPSFFKAPTYIHDCCHIASYI